MTDKERIKGYVASYLRLLAALVLTSPVQAIAQQPPVFAAAATAPTSAGRWIPTGNLNVARGPHHFAIRWNESESVHRICDGHMLNLIILVTDHRSKAFFID